MEVGRGNHPATIFIKNLKEGSRWLREGQGFLITSHPIYVHDEHIKEYNYVISQSIRNISDIM